MQQFVLSVLYQFRLYGDRVVNVQYMTAKINIRGTNKPDGTAVERDCIKLFCLLYNHRLIKYNFYSTNRSLIRILLTFWVKNKMADNIF